MHEELMAIMLHRRIEPFPDEILQSRRIQHHLFLGIVLKGVSEEFSHFPAVIIGVRYCPRIMKPFEFIIYVMVPQLVDWQQTLEACVHVAIQAIVLEANDAVFQLLVVEPLVLH